MAYLREEITKVAPKPCPGCPQARSLRVGGRGNIAADLVIIGEAPGAIELKNGIPFTGPSGQILEQCLPNFFDLDKQALIVNAIQCCPPRSQSQTRDKQLKAACVNACRQAVHDIIWSHPRKVLLVMGNWAAFHLFADGGFKITQKRGELDTVIDPVRNVEVQVVYAMHPASLLHGRGSPAAFKQDVQMALELTLGTEVMYGEGIRTLRQEYVNPTYEVLETPQQVANFMALTSKYDNVDVSNDLETHTLRPWKGGRILCAGMYGAWDNNVAHIIPWRNMDDPRFAEAVNELYARENIKWIWQGGKYDRRFLSCDPRIKNVPRLDDDTLLLSYALDEASKAHDLEEQAKNILGAPNYKDMVKPWVPSKKDSYEKIPEPVLFDYLARDVKNTWGIKQVTRARVSEDSNLEKLYTQTLLPAAPILTDIELYGFMTDANMVAQNRIDLQNDIQAHFEMLAEIAGRAVNPNSPPEVARLLYDDLGLMINNRRPKDTTKETLEKLPPNPAAKTIKMYRRLVKLLSTYVGGIELLNIEGVIHTEYKLHITTTGRLSSSDPNIQNIPREPRFKRMYCARPGYVLLEGDYNTAELRMLAVASKDRFLTGVFLDGKRNLHDEVSISMYGPDFTPDQRIRAKAVNFGIPYGREAFSIAEEFGISVREAQTLIDTWFATAPEAHTLIRRCRMAPLKGQSLVTVFGRKRRPGLVSRERLAGLQNEFANFIMQSTVSDFTLHSAISLFFALKPYGAHIVNLVHDSIILEVPDNLEIIRACAKLLKYTMEDTPTKWVDTPIKFLVDMKCGTHWGLLQDYDKWLDKRLAA